MQTSKKGTNISMLTTAEKGKLFSSSFSGGPTLINQMIRKKNEIIANRNKPLPSHPGHSQKQSNKTKTKGGAKTRKQKRSSKKTRKVKRS